MRGIDLLRTGKQGLGSLNQPIADLLPDGKGGEMRHENFKIMNL